MALGAGRAALLAIHIIHLAPPALIGLSVALSSLYLPHRAATGFAELALEHADVEQGLTCQQICRRLPGRRHGQRRTREALHPAAEPCGVDTRRPLLDGHDIVQAERRRIDRLRALSRGHDDE